jgi:hypothetical protein
VLQDDIRGDATNPNPSKYPSKPASAGYSLNYFRDDTQLAPAFQEAELMRLTNARARFTYYSSYARQVSDDQAVLDDRGIHSRRA